jgi:hypothetical protein
VYRLDFRIYGSRNKMKPECIEALINEKCPKNCYNCEKGREEKEVLKYA